MSFYLGEFIRSPQHAGLQMNSKIYAVCSQHEIIKHKYLMYCLSVCISRSSTPAANMFDRSQKGFSQKVFVFGIICFGAEFQTHAQSQPTPRSGRQPKAASFMEAGFRPEFGCSKAYNSEKYLRQKPVLRPYEICCDLERSRPRGRESDRPRSRRRGGDRECELSSRHCWDMMLRAHSLCC
jgi:hypothetical protein